ncbi:hypothetical protein [Thermoactinospora rubra]|uniref:hypothetical protein n=1 Tax=Thermoactinospora rubra TaxID=1088767 RepID=UPI000A117442|nr:hypothetical protein [Thermoactinospora rubra]
MADNLIETAGFGLLIAFAYFVWPPAALLVAGLVLLLVANVRSARKAKREGNAGHGFVERLLRTWLAAKAEQK